MWCVCVRARVRGENLVKHSSFCNREKERASMIRRRDRPSTPPIQSSAGASASDSNPPSDAAPARASSSRRRTSGESAIHFASLLFVVIQASWIVYHFQFLSLPRPLSAAEAGRRGFSEERAYKHVKQLTKFGPHPVGSEALDHAVEYVLSKVREVQTQAPWDVDVEVDFFHAKPGANWLQGGLFKGKTLAYANLKQVVVRVKPMSLAGSDDNAILVSSHIDTVVTTEGAGDCSSCVAVMLELVRAVSHWAHGFKHAIVFLFNTGEEEGLDGAHSFITQHPWKASIRTAIDLESMGIGGKSILFQGGPDKWIVEVYAKVAKYPAAQILVQDVFLSGFVKSATDFQVYKELLNISGLDFAYIRNGAVYHTKNDKLELLTPGSLQHMGENVLALLREVASSVDLKAVSTRNISTESLKWQMVYFDILGKYMVTYSVEFSKQMNFSVICQSLLLFFMSIYQGGLVSLVALSIVCLALVLTWTLSISFAVLTGIALPNLSNVAVPYIAHPWLALGLFGAPSLFGALVGHYIGYFLLRRYFLKVKGTVNGRLKQSCSQTELELLDWSAERWLFKAGFIQWLFILVLATWYGLGSSYIPLLWLVSPAVAYGVIDATFSPDRPPRELRSATLFLGFPVPLIASGGSFICAYKTLISAVVHSDRDPGSIAGWVANGHVAVLTAGLIIMCLIYILPYAHRSGGTLQILTGTIIILLISLSLVILGLVPPFTKHTGRVVNVVQVVEVGSPANNKPQLSSYVSLSSLTPGKLIHELDFLSEGFSCGMAEKLDFVTHVVKYGCISSVDAQDELNEYWMHQPALKLASVNFVGNERVTTVFIDTALSRRWVLAINIDHVRDFQLDAVFGEADIKQELVPRRTAVAVDGWHLVQFVTDQSGPHNFELTLYWPNTASSKGQSKGKPNPLLKLRTDINMVTAKVAATLGKLPEWVVAFGKSTSPYPLCYLVNLYVDFESQSIHA